MREWVTFSTGAIVGALGAVFLVAPAESVPRTRTIARAVDEAVAERDAAHLAEIQRMLDAQTKEQADQRFREHLKDELKTKRRMQPIVSAIEEQWGSFGADWHREFGTD